MSNTSRLFYPTDRKGCHSMNLRPLRSLHISSACDWKGVIAVFYKQSLLQGQYQVLKKTRGKQWRRDCPGNLVCCAGQKLNITDCPLEKLLFKAKHIWLMNGGDGPFNFFMQSYPLIRVRLNLLKSCCQKHFLRPFASESNILPQSSLAAREPIQLGWGFSMLPTA